MIDTGSLVQIGTSVVVLSGAAALFVACADMIRRLW